MIPISKYIYAQNWQNQSQGRNEAEGISDASAAAIANQICNNTIDKG